MALMVLPFDGTLLWVLIYFLGAIGTIEDASLRKDSVGWGDLECEIRSQWKHQFVRIKIDLPWIGPTTN